MKNKILNTTKLLGVTALFSLSANVMAVETVISTATVTVQNAFTFSETSPIDFGTIRVTPTLLGTALGSDVTINTVAAAIDTAVFTLASATGATTVVAGVTASGQTLIPGAAGVYTIAGVSPFASLTITVPAAVDAGTGATNPIALTAGAAPPRSGYFWMFDFEATVTSGTNTGSAYAGGNLTADLNGDASFTLGAKLATSDPAVGVVQTGYQDLAYTGNYTITVEY